MKWLQWSTFGAIAILGFAIQPASAQRADTSQVPPPATKLEGFDPAAERGFNALGGHTRGSDGEETSSAC